MTYSSWKIIHAVENNKIKTAVLSVIIIVVLASAGVALVIQCVNAENNKRSSPNSPTADCVYYESKSSSTLILECGKSAPPGISSPCIGAIVCFIALLFFIVICVTVMIWCINESFRKLPRSPQAQLLLAKPCMCGNRPADLHPIANYFKRSAEEEMLTKAIKHVLKGVKDEFLLVLGESGAGKTTLVHHVLQEMLNAKLIGRVIWFNNTYENGSLVTNEAGDVERLCAEIAKQIPGIKVSEKESAFVCLQQQLSKIRNLVLIVFDGLTDYNLLNCARRLKIPFVVISQRDCRLKQQVSKGNRMEIGRLKQAAVRDWLKIGSGNQEDIALPLLANIIAETMRYSKEPSSCIACWLPRQESVSNPVCKIRSVSRSFLLSNENGDTKLLVKDVLKFCLQFLSSCRKSWLDLFSKYSAFLLFEARSFVSDQDLAILWRVSLREARDILKAFHDHGLVRKVTVKSIEMAETIEEIGEDTENEGQEIEEFYEIHSLLHSAATTLFKELSGILDSGDEKSDAIYKMIFCNSLQETVGNISGTKACSTILNDRALSVLQDAVVGKRVRLLLCAVERLSPTAVSQALLSEWHASETILKKLFSQPWAFKNKRLCQLKCLITFIDHDPGKELISSAFFSLACQLQIAEKILEQCNEVMAPHVVSFLGSWGKFVQTKLLRIAIRLRFDKLNRLLLAKKHKEGAPKIADKNLLLDASRWGSPHIFELLFKSHLELCSSDSDLMGRALMLAVSRPDAFEEVARELLNYGANVNFLFRPGEKTVLMNAIDYANSRLEPVHWLLTRVEGLNLEVTNSDGETALMRCAKQSNCETVKLLLQRGANVRHVDNYGNTVLMKAAQNPNDANAEIIKVLITAYNDNKLRQRNFVHAANSKKQTALHMAAKGCVSSRDQTTVVETLIFYGADVNATDINGTTPLMVAASRVWCEAVKVLLLNSADPNIVDNFRETALTKAASFTAYTNLAQEILQANLFHVHTLDQPFELTSEGPAATEVDSLASMKYRAAVMKALDLNLSQNDEFIMSYGTVHGEVCTINQLRKHGARDDIVNKNNETPKTIIYKKHLSLTKSETKMRLLLNKMERDSCTVCQKQKSRIVNV